MFEDIHFTHRASPVFQQPGIDAHFVELVSRQDKKMLKLTNAVVSSEFEGQVPAREESHNVRLLIGLDANSTTLSVRYLLH